MGQILRKFVSRAPRYVLRPTDNQIFRYALNDQRMRPHSTRFLNLSETGVAFLVDQGVVPRIGETIKVEFPLPGGDQVAWWARVVRIEVWRPS